MYVQNSKLKKISESIQKHAYTDASNNIVNMCLWINVEYT